MRLASKLNLDYARMLSPTTYDSSYKKMNKEERIVYRLKQLREQVSKKAKLSLYKPQEAEKLLVQ